MKVPLSWLKEYVDVEITAGELAEKLTMAGFEVENMQVIGKGWDNVVVGRIMAVNPHPNADRLRLPTVDLATEQATVVCGAPNLKVGLKVAFARVGACLMDAHTGEMATLKAAKIRGIASSGMLCSEKELGLSDNHTGILVLPDDAPVGTPLADYLGETIFDVVITPNRPDCLSVIGIAREVAGLTDKKLQVAEAGYKEEGPEIKGQVAIEIQAPDLCPRYSATLITGVKLGESPSWMQKRLQASGMRPINNVVDITNYVMLEYGQPLHSFDYERLRGKKIVVRRAYEGEVLETLDGTERKLSTEMLVIADAERAVAVAGVMGGANTEVVDSTTTILLEAASFKPASIHYTGRTLGLPSEACTRFERGISPGMTLPALKRATQLLVDLCGGTAAKGIEEEYPGKIEKEPISLSAGDVKRILGSDFSLAQISHALAALGFEYQESGSSLLVAIPYWRSDVRLKVDLIEEVVRIIGLDKIPMTMPGQTLNRRSPAAIIGLKKQAGDVLTGLGFQEMISYSLTGLEIQQKLFAGSEMAIEASMLRLANPMTTEQAYLRPNLRASLMTALVSNRRHEENGIRLFEIGKVYKPKMSDLPDEREMLCGILSGPLIEKSWQGEGQPPDFFEAKGVVESLLGKLGVLARYEASQDGSLDSAQASIIIEENPVGIVGRMKNIVLGRFDLTDEVYMFEVDLLALAPNASVERVYRQIPKFPSVVRDMALVVDSDVLHRQVVDIIKSYPLVENVALFDVYQGEQVAGGKKSMAYRVTYQSNEHTLTDNEVNSVQQQILARLTKELGAELRG